MSTLLHKNDDNGPFDWQFKLLSTSALLYIWVYITANLVKLATALTLSHTHQLIL